MDAALPSEWQSADGPSSPSARGRRGAACVGDGMGYKYSGPSPTTKPYDKALRQRVSLASHSKSWIMTAFIDNPLCTKAVWDSRPGSTQLPLSGLCFMSALPQAGPQFIPIVREPLAICRLALSRLTARMACGSVVLSCALRADKHECRG